MNRSMHSMSSYISKDSAFMETCCLARNSLMSLWSQTIHPCLCYLFFGILPELLGFHPNLPKESHKDEYVRPPLADATEGTLPELPQDILMHIFATFEIPDLVRASSVCPSWRSACTSLRVSVKYKQSQTPCLIYTSESAGDRVACLYSLVEKRVYKLTLPEPPICSRSVIGSSQGLLVTVDERSEMQLVNPITGEQADLPSVITIEQVKPIYSDSGALHKYELAGDVHNPPSIFAPGELRDNLHHKAFVFPDKSTESYIVVLIHNPYSQLSFARVGGDTWTWLPPHTHFEDCIYKDGILYAVTSGGDVHAFDLSGPVVTAKIIMEMADPSMCLTMYIVQAPWGDLLHVWRSLADHDLEPEPSGFVFWNTDKIEVYEVDAKGKTLKKLCLDGHVLFLGHSESLCLSAEEYPALKANHAYFTDDSVLWTMGLKNNSRDIGILNLHNNSREELLSPQPWSNSQAPMWITPDLRKMNLALNK